MVCSSGDCRWRVGLSGTSTMKTKSILTSTPVLSLILKPSSRFFCRRLLGCALGLVCLVLPLATVQAAAINFVWDANSTGGGSDGSGTWHNANKWWNGTADQTWADGNAVFIGTNTSGIYTINLDSPVTATSVKIQTNNYTLTGATLTETGITLSKGVTAAITCSLNTSGGGISVGSGGGGTLTLGGGYASTGGNPSFNGNTLANSTLNITNGTYSSLGTWACNNLVINHSGGTFAYSVFNMGRSGPAIYNLSGGSLSTTANGFQISRGFAGTFNLSGAGVLGAVGNVAVASSVPDLPATQNEIGTLNISNGV